MHAAGLQPGRFPISGPWESEMAPTPQSIEWSKRVDLAYGAIHEALKTSLAGLSATQRRDIVIMACLLMVRRHTNNIAGAVRHSILKRLESLTIATMDGRGAPWGNEYDDRSAA